MSEHKTGGIEITSKRDGFRRGGIAHSRTPVVHDTYAFSSAQLAAIRAEPMLTVRDLDSAPPAEVTSASCGPSAAADVTPEDDAAPTGRRGRK